MDPITAVQEKRSEISINLITARVLIKGHDNWLLIGEGWRQLESISLPVPEIDHAIETIEVPHFSAVLLMRLFESPEHFIDIKVSRSGSIDG